MDRRPDDKMSEAQVFADYTKVNKLVAVLYGDMHNIARGFAYLQHFSLSSATDECEGSGVQSAQSTNFNTGNLNPASIGNNSTGDQYKWDWLYTAIRKTNVILEGVRKYKTPDNPLSTGDLNVRLGETYFFRGYYHFLCVRLYGEIVYMAHAGDITEDMNYKRESFHVIADKICKDMDSAIALLPANQPNADFFRAEKGAALSVKAIVRWMQATPYTMVVLFPAAKIASVKIMAINPNAGPLPAMQPKLLWICKVPMADPAIPYMPNIPPVILSAALTIRYIPGCGKCFMI
ncbi:RagB/SusD family nutrient uptake outer membrane protein [Paraflavitalea speifideaquila]|uniref:RagB/SusD family nutrient uptake outer membrane protein n=1 Tax=Paraflavitalea speifideaquila TaxID=3076558 RepID=UPI0028E64D17|nr:RagB/SusD family nutrient uptake outer membrane protein [Paraflavitalea speifideiaquila]